MHTKFSVLTKAKIMAKGIILLMYHYLNVTIFRTPLENVKCDYLQRISNFWDTQVKS